MTKIARSARGEPVDFDILQIRQALASAPVTISTEERRVFIDTKNGLKPKHVVNNGLKIIPTPAEAPSTKPVVLPDALSEVMSSIVEANTTVEASVEATSIAAAAAAE